jgi:hypothetical protein
MTWLRPEIAKSPVNNPPGSYDILRNFVLLGNAISSEFGEALEDFG